MDNASAGPSPGLRRDPSHRTTVEPFAGVVTVRFSSAILASSKGAKLLKEAGHADVFYVPFGDIYFDFLHRSRTATHCPFKGDASYWDVTAAGETRTDVMWAYEHPYDEVSTIRDHGAFYPDKVRVEAVRQGETDRPIP